MPLADATCRLNRSEVAFLGAINMNPAHCPQCGRAVSAVDQAGGSCPWCGRVLTTPYAAKSTVRRSTPTYSPRSSSSSNGGWSYWWIPVVAVGLLRGVSSCNRIHERDDYKPSYTTPNFQIPEYDRERVFDAQEFLQRIERERRERDPDDPVFGPNDTLPNIDEVLGPRREVLEGNGSDPDDFDAPIGDREDTMEPTTDELESPSDNATEDGSATAVDDATDDSSSPASPDDSPPPSED